MCRDRYGLRFRLEFWMWILLIASLLSQTESVRAGVQIAPTDASLGEPGRLFVLAIGIDKYAEISFEFAVVDAEAFVALIRERSTGINYTSTEVILLRDREASRTEILTAMDYLLAEVTSSDTLMFFFAGASSSRGSPDESVLLAYGSDLAGSPEAAFGILKDELGEWSEKLAAERQVFIFDCDSSAEWIRGLNYDSRDPTGRRKSRAQFMTTRAMENGLSEHGSLTDAILRGLTSGDFSGDGWASARELERFLYMTLPNYRAFPGRPLSFPRTWIDGDDFILARSDPVDLASFMTAPPEGTTGQSIDLHGPLFEILKPEPDKTGRPLVVSNNKLEVQVNVVDETGVAQVDIGAMTIAGQPRNSLYSTAVMLEPGENIISIRAWDQAGNMAESEIPVRLNTRTDRALLFASNAYGGWSNLSNPLYDAQEIADELEVNYGFKVEVVPNPKRATILSRLIDYAQLSYGPEDQLLILFAGHGFYDEIAHDGFIVASDSLSRAEDQYNSSFLPFASLERRLVGLPCQHIFLMLDVCFGGSFAQDLGNALARTESETAGGHREEFIKEKLKYKTRLFLSSGGIEPVPEGKESQHSPFAKKVLEALRGSGYPHDTLTIAKLYAKVETLNPQPQAGEFEGNEAGSDFLFIQK